MVVDYRGDWLVEEGIRRGGPLGLRARISELAFVERLYKNIGTDGDSSVDAEVTRLRERHACEELLKKLCDVESLAFRVTQASTDQSRHWLLRRVQEQTLFSLS